MEKKKKVDRLGVALSWQVARKPRRRAAGKRVLILLLLLILALIAGVAYGLFNEFMPFFK